MMRGGKVDIDAILEANRLLDEAKVPTDHLVVWVPDHGLFCLSCKTDVESCVRVKKP